MLNHLNLLPVAFLSPLEVRMAKILQEHHLSPVAILLKSSLVLLSYGVRRIVHHLLHSLAASHHYLLVSPLVLNYPMQLVNQVAISHDPHYSHPIADRPSSAFATALAFVIGLASAAVAFAFAVGHPLLLTRTVDGLLEYDYQ